MFDVLPLQALNHSLFPSSGLAVPILHNVIIDINMMTKNAQMGVINMIEKNNQNGVAVVQEAKENVQYQEYATMYI